MIGNTITNVEIKYENTVQELLLNRCIEMGWNQLRYD